MDKVKLAIIYYSSTGTNYQMAKWAEEAAKEAGAEVRVLKVKELAPPQAIDSNPAWRKHYDETQDVPEQHRRTWNGQMPSYSACLPDLA